MSSGRRRRLTSRTTNPSTKEPAMPVRDSYPIGAPCWIDLATTDTDKARAFYEALFGWTSESAGDEYGGYVNFSKDGHMVAGCMSNGGQPGPDRWTIYLTTDDAKATV